MWQETVYLEEGADNREAYLCLHFYHTCRQLHKAEIK